jgi:hypothetical protein
MKLEIDTGKIFRGIVVVMALLDVARRFASHLEIDLSTKDGKVEYKIEVGSCYLYTAGRETRSLS